MSTTCTLCDEPIWAHGWCHKHYDRWRRTGDAETPDQKRESWNRDVVRKRMFHNAKRRAKALGVPFDLDGADIVIPERCPALDIPLEVVGSKRSEASPSLDRMKPELGYVRGNVRVISWRANRIKNDSTPEELERIVRYVRSE